MTTDICNGEQVLIESQLSGVKKAPARQTMTLSSFMFPVRDVNNSTIHLYYYPNAKCIIKSMLASEHFDYALLRQNPALIREWFSLYKDYCPEYYDIAISDLADILKHQKQTIGSWFVRVEKDYDLTNEHEIIEAFCSADYIPVTAFDIMREHLRKTVPRGEFILEMKNVPTIFGGQIILDFPFVTWGESGLPQVEWTSRTVTPNRAIDAFIRSKRIITKDDAYDDISLKDFKTNRWSRVNTRNKIECLLGFENILRWIEYKYECLASENKRDTMIEDCCAEDYLQRIMNTPFRFGRMMRLHYAGIDIRELMSYFFDSKETRLYKSAIDQRYSSDYCPYCADYYYNKVGCYTYAERFYNVTAQLHTKGKGIYDIKHWSLVIWASNHKNDDIVTNYVHIGYVIINELLNDYDAKAALCHIWDVQNIDDVEKLLLMRATAIRHGHTIEDHEHFQIHFFNNNYIFQYGMEEFKCNGNVTLITEEILKKVRMIVNAMRYDEILPDIEYRDVWDLRHFYSLYPDDNNCKLSKIVRSLIATYLVLINDCNNEECRQFYEYISTKHKGSFGRNAQAESLPAAIVILSLSNMFQKYAKLVGEDRYSIPVGLE